MENTSGRAVPSLSQRLQPGGRITVAKVREHGPTQLARAHRWLTAPWRSLPDAIILGAQKSGTTSLFHYLSQHPQLVTSFTKEVHYFDGGRTTDDAFERRGVSWYRSNFPLTRSVPPGSVVFEASPLYLFHPHAPERIRRLLPHAKFIALLRDPTDRAISHYHHERHRGHEPLELRDALAAEEERLRPTGDARHDRYEAIHHSYRARGHYLQQLEPYWAQFPAEQVIVLPSERLFTEPAALLDEIHRFLDVEPFATPDLRARNVGAPRDEADPDVYDELDAHFAPSNEALFARLGQRYPWGADRA